MILVVDHDPEVLERAATVLNHTRHVLLASTAEEAFSMVRKLGGFSVVLVDLELPGAYPLIEKLHNSDPLLLIIAISGAMKSAVTEATEDLGVVEVLRKPVTPDWKPAVERVRARRFDG